MQDLKIEEVELMHILSYQTLSADKKLEKLSSSNKACFKKRSHVYNHRG